MSVVKFQYMPGGQGGGGGWARPTTGEASSISGRTANTTADTALRCSQGFIGHLLSVAFCVEIVRFVRCPEARFSADGGDRPGRIRTDASMANVPRDLVSGLIVCPHTVQGALLPRSRE